MARAYDPQLKAKALAIAAELGPAEAAKATGIPSGTIRSWLSRLQHSGAQRRNAPRNAAAQKRKTTIAIETVNQAAMAKAMEEASDYIAERIKALASRLYDLAEKAVFKINIAISTKEELVQEGVDVARYKGEMLERGKDGAAWLRSLIGVLSQSVDKGQLLSGRPTGRNEERKRHEYDITQRIISDPESVDLAEQLLRRASGRLGSGLDAVDHASAFRMDDE